MVSNSLDMSLISRQGKRKKVLVLGAGLVTPPLVSYLSSHDFSVCVANRTLENAKRITKDLPHTEAIQLDIETDEGKKLLEQLVPGFDAVSLNALCMYTVCWSRNAKQTSASFLKF